MDRATRKELKSDKFVLEVQHGVDYVSEHRQSLIRWSVVGVVALLIVVGIYFYTRHESTARAEALQNAMQVVNAQVGAPNSPYAQTFPTQADKDKAEIKTFTDLAARYPGSNEGIIAEFYLGALNSEQGNIDAAIKHFKAVADSDRSYSTLGKLALGRLYAAQGNLQQAEATVQSVIDHPNALVSKDQATIVLAEIVGPKDPAKARKLLEPLRASDRSAVSKAALTELSQLPQK